MQKIEVDLGAVLDSSPPTHVLYFTNFLLMFIT
jgi:hypothetical protein